ncbi:MAG: V-type ATP synthase subunit I [Clostridia bacterium]|nr:V-type ATP synthase subunit I [Clostridia bacterium]
MIAQMRKLTLIGSFGESEAMLDLLHKAGCVEIAPCRECAGTDKTDNNARIDELSLKIADCEFALGFIKDNVKASKTFASENKKEKKAGKSKKLLQPLPCLTYDEFNALSMLGDKTDALVSELKKISEGLIACASDKLKYDNYLNTIKPYLDLPISPRSLHNTQDTFITLGMIDANAFDSTADWLDNALCYMYGEGAQKVIAVICHKDYADSVSQALSDMEFSRCSLDIDVTPAHEEERVKSLLGEVEKKRQSLILQAASYESRIDDLRKIYDYYSVQYAKAGGLAQSRRTVSTYVMEAWIPLKCCDNLSAMLDSSPYALTYYLTEPEEGELVPTLADNNALVTPYESVTNMYSTPAYGEIDPNPFITFFFFIFFGIMLADVGYGLLLTLVTGIYLAIVRPPKGMKNMVKLIFMGGISTIFWGFLFGSYFGVSAADIGIWHWFNPITEPMNMLFLSLGLGLFQMLFGYTVNMVAMIRQKKPLEAIFGNSCWYFILIGGVMAFLGGKLASWLPYIGYVVLAVGLIFLVLSGAMGAKGIKKITSGLGRLYDIINFFSDLMSYTRLFGLGLASAVIAMVFNQIGIVIKDMMPSIPVLGWAIACVVFLIGHVFNIGINTLGAYVHDARLQFVEFYGKFYEGGGALFRPLGSQMRYYYINNNKYNTKNTSGGKN